MRTIGKKVFNIFTFAILFIASTSASFSQNCEECEEDCKRKISSLIYAKSVLERQREELKVTLAPKPCPPCDCSKWKRESSRRRDTIVYLRSRITQRDTIIKKMNLRGKSDSIVINTQKEEIDSLIFVTTLLRDTISLKTDTIQIKIDSIKLGESRFDTLVQMYGENTVKVVIEYKSPLGKIKYFSVNSDYKNDMKKKTKIKAKWVLRVLIYADFYSKENSSVIPANVFLIPLSDIKKQTVEPAYLHKQGSIGTYNRFEGRYINKGLKTPIKGKYVCKIECGKNHGQVEFTLD